MSTQNNELLNFLKQKKDVTSNLYKGTLFELQTLDTLRNVAGMTLTHVGGKSDGGIDLRGQWYNDINIIVQCKNTKQGCTPDHVRELMGTVMANTTPRKPVLGILSTAYVKPFTRDVMQHFNASPLPLGLATVQDAKLTSLLFNKKANSFLKGLVISTLYDAEGNESLYIEIPVNKESL